jgi:hypothetical protein
MAAGTLRFGVENPKLKWGAYFRDMVRGTSYAAGKMWESYSDRGASVVIRNANGEKRILCVTDTVREARDRATTIEQEYKTLDTTAWCERYNVPTSFVSG